MKRNLYTIACAFLGILAVASCDVMDTKPFTSFDDDAVWGSAETADAFVLQTYASTIDPGFATSGCATEWVAKTPDGVTCDQVYSRNDGVASELGINNTTDGGFNRFAALRACNLIIDRVSSSTNLNDTQKAKFIAEARFLRGTVYFNQARIMGRFVPVNKLLTVDDKEEMLTPITSTVAESYKYVFDDFDAALQGLPTSSDIERVNIYTVHFFRTRAGLQAYAYTGDTQYLDKVIESANVIISSGKYKLTSNYGDMFNQNSPRDPEIIMAKYFLKSNYHVGNFAEMMDVVPATSGDDVAMCGGKLNDPANIFFCYSYRWPTQELVDQYLAIDSKTGEAKNWWETSQYTENVIDLDPSTVTEGCIGRAKKGSEDRILPTAVDMKTSRTDLPLFTRYGQVKDGCSLDISDIMYENRDKRFDYVILRDKVTWCGEFCGTNLLGSVYQGVRAKPEGGWFTTCTGYYFKKGVYTASRLYDPIATDYHYVIARLGEVYMNLAEAYLLKKDWAAAVKALNETRVNHGGLPASTASNEANAWADYMRERRCEMAIEAGGDGYFTYLRWGKYGGYANHGRQPGDVIADLDVPVHKICISQDRKKYCINQLTLLNCDNRAFTTRRYLYPIPQGQLDTRAIYGIKESQNEGW